MTDSDPNYSLAPPDAGQQIPAPELPYRPRDPRRYRPRIGLIGCGGIAATHLTAYRKAGYDVVALCSRVEAKARARQQEFYPDAAVYTDYRDVLARADVDVVDLTPHPEQRVAMLEDALRARKHVLCQKPLATDLDYGRRMADLADELGVKLAVNQNGRFAPHFGYLRETVAAGLVGQPIAVHLAVHWDHNWIKDLPFNDVRHIILYDFGIHWFDFLQSVMGARAARRVYASFVRSPSQLATPPLLAQAVVEYDDAQASLIFDADTRFGAEDHTLIVGTAGTARSVGTSLSEQTITVVTRQGWFSPRLEGTWFPDGFHGTMADLACAIEENRQPLCNARDNLRSLALCFAAVHSAETHRPVVPGEVTKLEVG